MGTSPLLGAQQAPQQHESKPKQKLKSTSCQHSLPGAAAGCCIIGPKNPQQSVVMVRAGCFQQLVSHWTPPAPWTSGSPPRSFLGWTKGKDTHSAYKLSPGPSDPLEWVPRYRGHMAPLWATRLELGKCEYSRVLTDTDEQKELTLFPTVSSSMVLFTVPD